MSEKRRVSAHPRSNLGRRWWLTPALSLALAACGLIAAAPAFAQEDDVANEYRLTLFPNYPLGDRLTGFGYLGYVTNPDRDYKLYYLGWPGFAWTAKPRVLQIWAGLFGIYTDNGAKSDKLELRPFVGLKAFLPNDAKINLYNFSRYEYRATKDLDTHDWKYVNRFRTRIGAEIPLVSRERAWQHKTFYAIADAEAFYRFDRDTWDPVRLRAGLGYVLAGICRAELIYHAQFTRPTAEGQGPLEYTDNIFRLNIKIGLKHGVLPRLMDADADE